MEKRKTDISELADLLNDLISPTEALFADIQGQIAASFSKERLSRNLSQKQFAELIGASQSQVSKWESGDFNFLILVKRTSHGVFNRTETDIEPCVFDKEIDFRRQDVFHLKRRIDIDIVAPTPKGLRREQAHQSKAMVTMRVAYEDVAKA